MSTEAVPVIASPDVAVSLPLRLAAIEEVPVADWEALAQRAAEANAFYDPDFSRAAFSLAKYGGGGAVLTARSGGQLVALLPVVSARRALHLPVPALVARQPYAPLTTPLLDAGDPEAAVEALLDAAAASGARLLELPALTLDGTAGKALLATLARRGITPFCLEIHERAALDANQEAEAYLRGGMGAKKLKELRRQRHRLDDEGAVAFQLAETPEAIGAALERFLALEASGWKGRDGTGLGQHDGDAAFVRSMALGMGKRGAFQVLELLLNGRTIASGLVLRQAGAAFFFKIAYDETLSRFSPGVQLTVELTRQLSEDPTIAFADSTADAGHPMIDHVWRERIRIADMLVPLRPNDSMAALLVLVLRLRAAARQVAKRTYHFFKTFKERRL